MGDLMRRIVWVLLVAVAGLSGRAMAQDDGDDSPEAVRMRQQIETRFGAQVQEMLGLTDQQATQLRATLGTYAPKRRAMEREERGIKRALQAQLLFFRELDLQKALRDVSYPERHRDAAAKLRAVVGELEGRLSRR